MRGFNPALCALLFVLVGSGYADAQPVAVGDEFTVNTYTTGPQREPAACFAPDGDVIVAWKDGRANQFGSDTSVDGSETAIVARRMSDDPGNVTFDFQVNTFTTGRTEDPSVACLPDGGFAVVWTDLEEFAPQGSPAGRFAVTGQRFGPDAQPAGGELVLEQGENFFGTPDEISVCNGADGGFVAVYNSVFRAGGANGEDTEAQLFDSEGDPVGTPIPVFPGGGNRPECCGGENGFVVAWWAGSGVTSSPEVFARRYASDGTAVGTQFMVNTYTTDLQGNPVVACKADGDFVVVWESKPQFGTGQDGDGYGIFGQRFDAGGDPLGTEFQINSTTDGDQFEPTVAMDGAGRFVVAWTDYQYLGFQQEAENVVAQAYDSTGLPAGTEFQVNTFVGDTSSSPAAAALPSGDAIITWSTSNDGDDHSISAQRYSLGPPPGPSLSLTKTDNGHVWSNDPVIPYDITVTAVNGPASGVLLTDVVPESTTFHAAGSTAGWTCVPDGSAGSTCTFDVGDLASGASEMVTFASRVDDGTDDSWDVYNRVTVQADDSVVAAPLDGLSSATGGFFGPTDEELTMAALFACDAGSTIACVLYCFYCGIGDLTDDSEIEALCGFPQGGSLRADFRAPRSPDRALQTASSVGLTLYRIRDRILSDTRGGQRAIQLYYDQSPAMVAAAVADTGVATLALAALDAWAPNLVALADGAGDTVTITQAQVDAMNAFLDALRAAADPDLAAAIDRERPLLDIDSWVGMDMNDALDRFEDLTCEGFETILFCGELTGDCRVTPTDALRILRIFTGLDPFDQAADMDGNGTVAPTDALIALRIAVSLDQQRNDCNI